MPGKSREARSKQMLLRLTDEEHEVLAAAAYLEGTTPTELAREQVAAYVVQRAASDRVRRVIRERQEHEAEKDGKLRAIANARREGRQGPGE